MLSILRLRSGTYLLKRLHRLSVEANRSVRAKVNVSGSGSLEAEFIKSEYNRKGWMVLTGPHEVIEGQDTSRKAHHEDDKGEMVLLSDCSGSE